MVFLQGQLVWDLWREAKAQQAMGVTGICSLRFPHLPSTLLPPKSDLHLCFSKILFKASSEVIKIANIRYNWWDHNPDKSSFLIYR